MNEKFERKINNMYKTHSNSSQSTSNQTTWSDEVTHSNMLKTSYSNSSQSYSNQTTNSLKGQGLLLEYSKPKNELTQQDYLQIFSEIDQLKGKSIKYVHCLNITSKTRSIFRIQLNDSLENFSSTKVIYNDIEISIQVNIKYFC